MTQEHFVELVDLSKNYLGNVERGECEISRNHGSGRATFWPPDRRRAGVVTAAGFRDASQHPLPPTAESAVIATQEHLDHRSRQAQ